VGVGGLSVVRCPFPVGNGTEVGSFSAGDGARLIFEVAENADFQGTSDGQTVSIDIRPAGVSHANETERS
jgi:hypothetical protein